jgi:tetratricopeptide (TPR) repeat protein
VRAAPPATAAPKAGNHALAEQHLQRGLDHYDRGETEQALAAYQASAQADPGFAMAHNNLGMVLIDLERYEEALDALYTSVCCDPEYGEAYSNLGFVLRRMQRNVEAASAYVRFLEIEPDVEEGSRITGWIDTVLKDNHLTEVPRFKFPEPDADPAPVAAPVAATEPPKIKKMAAWEVAAGNVETAAPINALGEIAAAPAEPPVPNVGAQTVVARAPALGFLGKAPAAPAPAPLVPTPGAPVAAEQMPLPAVTVVTPAPVAAAPAKPAVGLKAPATGAAAPGGIISFIEKGLDQFADGNFDEAAKMLQQALALDPNNAEAHAAMGKVLVRQEKLDEGIAELQKAVELAPDDPAPYYVLGFALRALERNVEAAETYETFLKLMPKALDAAKISQWVSHIKGAAAVGSGPKGDLEILDDEPVTSASDQQYKQALDLFKAGDTDGALRQCVAVLNEDSGHVRSRLLLGCGYLSQKSHDLAIEQLEGALVSRPDFPEALYFLGLACEESNKRDKAQQHFKRYIEVSPDGPRAAWISDWQAEHPAAAPVEGKQVQCELCLRFFAESEISQHEGKATCNSCLTVMGAGPVLAKSMADSTVTPAAKIREALPEAQAKTEPIRKSKKGVLVAAVLVMGLAALGFLYTQGKLDPLLVMAGLKQKKPKPTTPTGGPDGPVVPDPNTPNLIDPAKAPLDLSRVKLAKDPATAAPPCARWTCAPTVEGLTEQRPDARIEVTVKDAPPGMTVEKNVISWTPKPADFDTLKAGLQTRFEINIDIVDAAGAKLGSLPPVPVSLSTRFAYEFGPALDLGVAANERLSAAVGDLNGDKLPDLLLCSGEYRKGMVRLFLHRPEAPVPPSSTVLDRNARFSALAVSDLDGDGLQDVLAANWLNGEIRVFFQDAVQPVAGAPFFVGPGPIAVAVNDVDGDKRQEIATLLGAGGKLVLTSVKADKTFTDKVEIPLPSGGPKGFVFGWNSAAAGPGFLAVVPLAEQPLQFVPYNKGAWTKGAAPVASKIDSTGVITAASPMTVAGGAKRLAVCVGNALMVLDEKSGAFAAIGTPVALPGAGLNVLAQDFNGDGQDDLLVVMADKVSFYFAAGDDLLPGPTLKMPGLLGLVVLFQQNPQGPELLLIDAERKARFLKPAGPAPETPAGKQEKDRP